MNKYISSLFLALILLIPQEFFALDFSANVKSSTAISSILNFEYNPLADGLMLRRSRGGSFGGRRSRSRTKTRSKASSKRSKQRAAARKRENAKKPSFGGSRMKPAAARKKYGTPRKTTQMTGKSAAGVSQNYNVHHYGGYGSGLMTGYLMGSSMWYWSMPFHPAFYYSRPVYVENGTGAYDVYPPTISYTKIFFAIAIVVVIVYFIRKRKSKSNNNSTSSFG